MAISDERQTKLVQIFEQLKNNPELLARIKGETPQVSPGIVAEEAGIVSPITKTVSDKLAAEAIKRAGPEFKQTQAERVTSLKRFGKIGQAGGRPGEKTGIEFDPSKGFVEIPTERTEEGGIRSKFERDPESVLKDEVAGILARSRVEAGAKLEEGQRASERSLTVISTSLNDFSKLIVDAFDEGGFGDIIKAGKTALKQKFAGGLATRELSRTSAIPGKKVEIITKMMPLLTQQGDKPGSVRLVSTVFERLSDSLPGANLRGDVRGNDISLEEARAMLSETILSMLRFAQAIQSLGITNEDVDRIPGKVSTNPNGSTTVEKGSELSQFGDLIERTSQQFFTEGSDEEQQILDFISLALEPLDVKIAEENRKRTEGGTEAGQLSTEDAEELRLIDEELAR